MNLFIFCAVAVALSLAGAARIEETREKASGVNLNFKSKQLAFRGNAEFDQNKPAADSSSKRPAKPLGVTKPLSYESESMGTESGPSNYPYSKNKESKSYYKIGGSYAAPSTSETITFSFNYDSSYALSYKNAVYSVLRFDTSNFLPNKYFCKSVTGNIPFNCYSENLSYQQLIMVVCPYFTTFKCNQCNPNPCQNGGSCTTSSTNVPVCNCRFGWKGDRCQTLDLCPSNPCGQYLSNTATCHKIVTTLPVTAGTSHVLSIGSGYVTGPLNIGTGNNAPLCQEICFCEPLTPTCNLNKYFYVEGKFSIVTGTVSAPTDSGPNPYSTGTSTGSIVVNNGNSLTCTNVITGAVGTTSAAAPISGVKYNDFVGNANIFCPVTKFSVDNCLNPRNFIPIVANTTMPYGAANNGYGASNNGYMAGGPSSYY